MCEKCIRDDHPDATEEEIADLKRQKARVDELFPVFAQRLADVFVNPIFDEYQNDPEKSPVSAALLQAIAANLGNLIAKLTAPEDAPATFKNLGEIAHAHLVDTMEKSGAAMVVDGGKIADPASALRAIGEAIKNLGPDASEAEIKAAISGAVKNSGKVEVTKDLSDEDRSRVNPVLRRLNPELFATGTKH